MQYYRHQDNKGRLSDQKAKAKARERMKRRRNAKIVWFVVIVVILAALWFTVGQTYVLPYVTAQGRAVGEDVTGAATGTAGLFSREQLREEEAIAEREIEGAGMHGTREVGSSE